MSGVCGLDASAALSLLVVDQATSAAKSFCLEPSHEWGAPRLLQLEVRNAIHPLERRGVIAVETIGERLVLLETEIRFVAWSDAAVLPNVLTRARKASPSVHDAMYLETAVRERAALATRDAALLIASLDTALKTFDLR